MGGLEIQRPQPPTGGMVADRALCVDRSQSVLVEDGSPDSAFLLVGRGQVIPAEVVARLGLRMAEGRVVQGQEPSPAVAAPVAVPVVEAPPVAPAPIMPPESRRAPKK